MVIEGETGPNVCSVPFDANTAISVGLLPEGLAILSLLEPWLTSFSLESFINDRLLKTCIDDSFLYIFRNTCFLVPIYLVASLGLGLMKASGDLLNVAS